VAVTDPEVGYVTGWELSRYPGRGPEDGMAVVAVFAGQPTPEERRAVLADAWAAVLESFRDRGIPMPPGGWRSAVLHPDEDWRCWVSESVARDAERRLDAAGPDAVVSVVYAFRFPAW
jgi:hypothetical protein